MNTQNAIEYFNTPMGGLFKSQVAKHMISGMDIDSSVLAATNDINNLLQNDNFKQDIIVRAVEIAKSN